ncbi:MAG: hypothetical protein JSR33_13680 [Proteobacteria bacterium]|nr:hypothetical protein [Pseudomonadota bacterium]
MKLLGNFCLIVAALVTRNVNAFWPPVCKYPDEPKITWTGNGGTGSAFIADIPCGEPSRWMTFFATYNDPRRGDGTPRIGNELVGEICKNTDNGQQDGLAGELYWIPSPYLGGPGC